MSVKYRAFWKVGLLMLLTVFSQLAMAQSKQIKGVITDGSDGTTLPGAYIVEKGTTNGTVTDFDGNYSLSVSEGATLVITFVGFESQEVVVGSQTQIDVALGLNFAELEEVVVVGYGETTSKELTGAIQQIKGDAVEQRKVPRLDQALQGQMSGVNITTNSGAPGGSANIRIRGITSNGVNDPLILVDGVVYDVAGLNSLNPSDIASVNVLKDATAGIYGVRGANGVIIIETKKGKLNSKPSFEFGGYYGVQSTARRLDLLDAREYAILKNEAFAAGGQAQPFANTALGEGTDWQDEVFQTAPMQNWNLSVTGGTDKTTYNIGGSYFAQEGIVGGDKANFERYNARINFVTELAPRVKLTNVLLFTREESSGVAQGGIGSVLYNTVNAYPTEPVRVDDRYSYLDNVADIINPLAQMENTYNWGSANKFTGKEEISYEINDDFTLTGTAGYVYAVTEGKTFNPLTWYGEGKFANSAANANLDPTILTIGDVDLERGSSVAENRATYLDFNLEAYLNYGHTFGSSTFKGTLGVTYYGNNSEGLNGIGFNIPNNSLALADISTNQAANGYLNNVGSFQVQSRLASVFLRAEYDFEKRYLVSAVIRRDGSSSFGPNNRFGYFPSISGAWVFSDEPFFSSTVIDFGKLRLSYGVLGNDRFGGPAFRYRANLVGEGVYVLGDVITQGTAIGAAANPDLKWEQTQQFNVGVDLTLFNSIDFATNYFVKNTVDLLFEPAVSAVLGTYGAGSFPPTVNGGDVRNSGIELDMTYTYRSNNSFTFSANYNVTFIKNEVTRVPDGFDFIPGAAFSVGGINATRFQKGFPIGYFVGLETDGIFQSAEEIASSPVSQPGAQPGDLRFVDQNGDGMITFGDDADRTQIGSPIPDATMGLNLNVGYMGIDLSANFYASLGNDIIRNYERQQPYANQLAYNVNRWTGEGSTNEYPRLTTGATQNTAFSTFYVEDGSFARLRNVQLGYTIPEKLLGGLGVKSLKFYVSANNLFTLTKYQGYDPDVGTGGLGGGVDFGIYPQSRVFMGGLNLKF